jgi:hypothetical protein
MEHKLPKVEITGLIGFPLILYSAIRLLLISLTQNRGNKDTVFEGGIKGSAFVWGSMVPSGVTIDSLMRIIFACVQLKVLVKFYFILADITDWLPTIVAAVGGIL